MNYEQFTKPYEVGTKRKYNTKNTILYISRWSMESCVLLENKSSIYTWDLLWFMLEKKRFDLTMQTLKD